MPHYGIAAWCADPTGIDRDAFGVAKRHGLAAVHLAIGTSGDVVSLKRSEWKAEVMHRCHETDVRVSCLALNIVENLAICGAGRNDLDRRWFQEIFMAAIEFAAEAVIPLIYIPSFGLAEITSNKMLCETAELIWSAAEFARPLEIDVASENSLGPSDILRLIDMVGLDNFKILFDVYNPLRWGHSPMEIIAVGFSSFANQIHVKDGWLPRYGNAPLGAGDGEVVDVVRELIRRGFGGTFVLENDYLKEPGLDIRNDLETLSAACTTRN